MRCQPFIPFALTCMAGTACTSERGIGGIWSIGPALEEPARWDDPSQASTVGTRFVGALPDQDRVMYTFRLFVHAERAGRGVARELPSGVEVPFTFESGVQEVSRPGELYYFGPETADLRLETGAVVVETTVPVEVVLVWSSYEDHASARMLPIEELGTEYRLISTPGGPSDFEQYAVVAVYDGTRVEGPGIGTVQLDAGEAVHTYRTHEIDGARVSANQPVAVFSGGSEFVGGDSTHETAWTQLPARGRWGTDYLAMPVDGHPANVLMLTAAEPAEITLGDDRLVTLQPGQVLREPLPEVTAVRSDVPIQAAVQTRPTEWFINQWGVRDSGPGSRLAGGDPGVGGVPLEPLRPSVANRRARPPRGGRSPGIRLQRGVGCAGVLLQRGLRLPRVRRWPPVGPCGAGPRLDQAIGCDHRSGR